MPAGSAGGKPTMNESTGEAGQKPDRATRFDISMPLRYRLNGEKTWRRGKVENVSRTGVLFSARLDIEPGLPVEMILQLPLESAGPGAAKIRCKGNIIRTARLPSSGQTLALAAQIRTFKFMPHLPA